MTIRIGNAPCSRGVGFPDDPRTPPWRDLLHQSGYDGCCTIERDCDPQA